MAARELLEGIPTPALLLEWPILRRNVARMAELCRRHGKALWPHTKTHKLPRLARLQLEEGARGLTVAKVSEGAVMAGEGLGPLFIANEVAGAAKARDLGALAARARLSVGLDNGANAAWLNGALEAAGAEADVLIEVDTGLGRAGVATAEQALGLAKVVGGLRRLRLAGVFTHEGQVYRASTGAEIEEMTGRAARTLGAIAGALEGAGWACERVSMGATPSARFAAARPEVSELRPGTYVFNDANQIALGAAGEEECALTVLATVTSRPAPDRVVLDAGSKALTSDPAAGPRGGFGLLRGIPGAQIVRLFEEHAVVSVPPASALAVGDPVEVIPNHVCPVVNLFDELHVVEGDRLLGVWPIAARGCSR